jgi:hypothetical protein
MVILVLFVLDGLPDRLWAQDSSATPIPTQELEGAEEFPICVEGGLPSSGPTPSPNEHVARCKLPASSQISYDLVALYESGQDLAAIGFAGDPVSGGQAAAAGRQDELQMYLPSVIRFGPPLANPSSLSDTTGVTSTGDIVYTDKLNHPYIPFDKLPECEDILDSSSHSSVPDPLAPQCRAKSVAYDLKYLYEQGVNLQDLGFAGDPKQPEADSRTDSDVRESATTGTPTYSWAQYDLTVPGGYPGIHSLRGVVSGKAPSLTYGYSWSDYHYYDRLQMVSSSLSYCGQMSKLVLGVAYGTFNSTTISGYPTLVWERYTHQGCSFNLTNVQTVNSLHLWIVYYSANRYLGEAWINNQWVVMFDESVNWGPATRVAAGHEIWARYQNKQNIHVPTNFVSQLSVGDYPWADSVFSITRPELSGATIIYADQPFNVMDLTGPTNISYTSMTVSAN